MQVDEPDKSTATDKPKDVTVSFTEFLEQFPPNETVNVSDLAPLDTDGWNRLNKSDLELHCTSEKCNGIRSFYLFSDAKRLLKTNQSLDVFLTYLCRNCRENLKTFAVMVLLDDGLGVGTAMKYGEIPAFGPTTPARLITLLGPDRDLFLRGRRSENQGLGIGAFAYYRRVVENQKGRIIRAMGDAATKLGAEPQVVEQFKLAEKETRFSEAIKLVGAAIPKEFLIYGQNPLSLLHTALSEGLHDRSEEYCLRLAQDIRLVLAELSEKMAVALKDEKDLREAVNRLRTAK